MAAAAAATIIAPPIEAPAPPIDDRTPVRAHNPSPPPPSHAADEYMQALRASCAEKRPCVRTPVAAALIESVRVARHELIQIEGPWSMYKFERGAVCPCGSKNTASERVDCACMRSAHTEGECAYRANPALYGPWLCPVCRARDVYERAVDRLLADAKASASVEETARLPVRTWEEEDRLGWLLDSAEAEVTELRHKIRAARAMM